MDASSGKDNKTPNRLQTAYIIPAADGCRVIRAYYTMESAEGFGRRFSNIANTLVVINRNA